MKMTFGNFAAPKVLVENIRLIALAQTTPNTCGFMTFLHKTGKSPRKYDYRNLRHCVTCHRNAK